MLTKIGKNEKRGHVHERIRKKLQGTAERPRLNVYRSLNHIYVQVIDDLNGKTLVSASSAEGKKEQRRTGGNVASAKKVGKAIAERKPPPGLVHHSDRGVQYACDDYSELLKQHQITISMSRKGNPYDNAACESFMKTLKYEEVYRQEYRDLAEALASVGEFIDRTYNQKRLHSALGYRPPEEFERIQSDVEAIKK